MKCLLLPRDLFFVQKKEPEHAVDHQCDGLIRLRPMVEEPLVNVLLTSNKDRWSELIRKTLGATASYYDGVSTWLQSLCQEPND